MAWLAGRVTLASFNASPAGEAVAVMLSCCASRRFADAMAAGRPYRSLTAAQGATQTAFESLNGNSGGFPIAIANLFAAGGPLVQDIVTRWHLWKSGVPTD